MGKVEANNEIIRMRQFVRQARVCVIHKLTREARTLRTKSGTEKQQEKNKKKADKLISEVYALKKIKDDDITKFGITNKKNLQEILQSTNANENIRVMARIADYKSLKNAIIQFRETYSDYEQYLQPGKRKSAKQKVKSQEKEGNNIENKRETRASSRKVQSKSIEHASTDELNSDKCTDESNNNNNNGEDNEHSDVENDLEQCNSEPGSILKIKPSADVPTEHKKNKRLKRDRKQSVESKEEPDHVYDNKDSKNVKIAQVKETSKEDKAQGTVKVISKQATVKRFTELLQDQGSKEDGFLKEKDGEISVENKPESEKQIDSFFISGDGDAYLSVAPSVVEENKNLHEDEDDNYNTSRRYTNKRTFTNDRFFSNIKSTDAVRRKGKQNESRQNDNNFNENKGSFTKQRNANASSLRNATKKRSNDVRTNSNESENLHPSWAAKKKQQEIVKQGFQGKKIVFNDD